MTHRPIKAIELNGIIPGGTPRALPIFEWVDPGTLLVDEAYQRESSERSLKLVRKIIAGWDWARFKPPVGVLTDAGIEMIDGQHTAIAAASHPDIEKIPVMIVDVPERAERAGAFIGHNKDRVAVTAIQLHIAAIAAGDAEAQTIQNICDHAGVVIVKSSSGSGKFEAGQTMAVAAIGAIAREWGVEHAVTVMETLGRTSLAPINAVHIRAASLLLVDPEYSDQINKDQIVGIVETMGPKADQEAAVFRAAHPSTPLWKALAITWFKARRSSQKAQVVTKPAGDQLLQVATNVIAKPSAPTSGKRDTRAAVSGWKPGVFLLRCSGCDETYQGDKRSRSCADCAYGCREAISA